MGNKRKKRRKRANINKAIIKCENLNCEELTYYLYRPKVNQEKVFQEESNKKTNLLNITLIMLIIINLIWTFIFFTRI
ncbi:hypothetical protein ACSXAY_02355 [Clostridium perfringens]